MSLLRKVFKSRKRKSVDATEDSINELKDMEDLLVRKQLFYEQKIDAEVESAKKHGKKNQRSALAALRRKKMYEQELTRIDGILLKIEGQRTALENAGSNVAVLEVLAQTNKTLKKANNDLDINKVDSIMEDIAESLNEADEIASAISTPIGGIQVDEDELMDELRELEAEKDVPINLPDVPRRPITRSLSRQISKQADDLSQLEMWATN